MLAFVTGWWQAENTAALAVAQWLRVIAVPAVGPQGGALAECGAPAKGLETA